MSTRCSSCSYGPYDPLSDICDDCTSDADTGWCGLTDHRVGVHFSTEEEQEDFYSTFDEEYYDYDILL